jgi:hypothetical protein
MKEQNLLKRINHLLEGQSSMDMKWKKSTAEKVKKQFPGVTTYHNAWSDLAIYTNNKHPVAKIKKWVEKNATGPISNIKSYKEIRPPYKEVISVGFYY